MSAASPNRLRRSPAGRALLWFWALVLLALAGGAVALQLLGPPPQRLVSRETNPAPSQPGPGPGNVAPPRAATPTTVVPERAPGAPIPDPSPAMLEPYPSDPAYSLPRIGPDGTPPRLYYAGGAEPADARPRVAMLLGGIGLSDIDADDAARQLPPAVTFAVSPYSIRPEALLARLRAQGREYLTSLPLEPLGFPLNDAGPRALLTSASPEQNLDRLNWTLSRLRGYAGVTGALDGMRGERMAASANQMAPVLEVIAARGLFYVDAAPGQTRLNPSPAEPASARTVDVVIDEPAVRSEIELKLTRLESMARDHGSAIGLADLPRPVTIDRLAAWTRTLGSRGFVLVPVSALMPPPPARPAAPPTTAAR